MEMEVGKIYKNRKGNKCMAMERSDRFCNGSIVAVYQYGGTSYFVDKDGKKITAGPLGLNDDLDIISEWV